MDCSRETFRGILHGAGQIMLSATKIESAVSEKEGEANFVTKYDVAVQHFLQEKLLAAVPEARFVGEEEDIRADIRKGYAFIVDPIDGTTNFIKGLGCSAVSVGLLLEGEVILAAVYNPYRDEFFFAEKGKGAQLNGVPLHASPLPLAESIVMFGTAPYYKELREPTFALAREMMGHALDLRRSGSAVFDLTTIARGGAGFFFEKRLSPWDYAASSLIVTEAGGMISQPDGSPLVFDRPIPVIAGGAQAYRDFFRLGLDRI